MKSENNFFYGLNVTVIYFITAVYGISVLEAQNYFSHYGLRRKMKAKNSFLLRNEFIFQTCLFIVGNDFIDSLNSIMPFKSTK